MDLVFCLFSIFMQFRKLLCDNLGGNKLALSLAKERASLGRVLGWLGISMESLWESLLAWSFLFFLDWTLRLIRCVERGVRKGGRVGLGLALSPRGPHRETRAAEYSTSGFQRTRIFSL